MEQVVYPILKQFGEVSVGGSYVYQLLSHPDIDLDVVNPNLTKKMCAELCSRFIELNSVSKFRTNDKVHFPHTYPGERPTGYWIAPHIHFGDNIWSLDIWFQIPEWNTGETNSYKQKLASISDAQKISILSLKEELVRSGVYGVGKEYLSVDVYDAVLNADVSTVSELKAYKASIQSR